MRTCRILDVGDRSPRPVDSRCRRAVRLGRLEPGRHHAGTWRATICKIYLYDAATGIRKATLEGSTNAGITSAFHPAGTLLASNGWEGRLRLWDAVLGRPVLEPDRRRFLGMPEFSQDGRIVVSLEDD